MNQFEHHIECEDCKLWSPYTTGSMLMGTEQDRIPDNCSTWLCNTGKCPLDKEQIKSEN